MFLVELFVRSFADLLKRFLPQINLIGCWGLWGFHLKKMGFGLSSWFFKVFRVVVLGVSDFLVFVRESRRVLSM